MTWWALVVIIVITAGLGVGVVWIKDVNDRLDRIERTLDVKEWERALKEKGLLL